MVTSKRQSEVGNDGEGQAGQASNSWSGRHESGS